MNFRWLCEVSGGYLTPSEPKGKRRGKEPLFIRPNTLALLTLGVVPLRRDEEDKLVGCPTSELYLQSIVDRFKAQET